MEVNRRKQNRAGRKSGAEWSGGVLGGGGGAAEGGEKKQRWG